MTNSEIAPRPGSGGSPAARPSAAPGTGVVPVAGGAVAPAAPPAGRVSAPDALGRREAPSRPPIAAKEAAPVLVKLTPPFPVRVSQLLWILSFAAGVFAIGYMFVIREAQLPDIAALIQQVDASRVAETYDSAADIVYWAVFAGLVAVLLLQLTFLVSFSNRRPRTRWFQLGTIVFQSIVLILARELIAVGDRGAPLTMALLVQLGLALLALTVSTLPVAIRWSARRRDIGRSGAAAF